MSILVMNLEANEPHEHRDVFDYGDNAMINLTPHAIVIQIIKKGYSEKITIPPSGTVARVVHHEQFINKITLEGESVDVISRTAVNITGLPPVECVEPVIVSSMVLDAMKQAGGYDEYPAYAPDTGETAIRNEKGHIIAVTRLVA